MYDKKERIIKKLLLPASHEATTNKYNLKL